MISHNLARDLGALCSGVSLIPQRNRSSSLLFASKISQYADFFLTPVNDDWVFIKNAEFSALVWQFIAFNSSSF